MLLVIWLSHTMTNYWFQLVVNLMVKCLFGTLTTDILSPHFKLHLPFSLMEFHQFNGVDSLRISNLEIPATINSLLLALKNLLFGLLTQQQEVVNTKPSKLEQWSEIIHALHFQNQTKNFYLLDQNQETSVLSKWKTKCSYSVNQFVLRVSKMYRLLPMTRSVLVVVMAKLSYSMLIKISVSHSCRHNFMEVFKV